MRKRTHRTLAVTLASIMAVSCLAGCGAESSIEKDSTAEQGAGNTGTNEQAVAENTEPIQATYPLSEEPVTLTVYMRDSSSGAIADYNEIAGYKAALEKVGVNVEFMIPAVGSEADQFNLMITSGKYPDIILWDFSSTPMTLAEMVDSGVLIDMDPYIRKYAPNYLAAANAKEECRKEATSDGGRLLAMYAFDSDLILSGGPAMRADLLEANALEVPETIEDWTNVMTALKEAGVSYPLTAGKGRTGSVWFDGFMPAYKTHYTFCKDDSDNVVYGPVTDNFREYLRQMNAWYMAGLIDPEFMSNDGTAMNAKLTDGRSAAGSNLMMSYHIGNITKAAREDNPDFEFVGCPWPVLNEGDEPQFIRDTGVLSYSGRQAAITSACKDPVLATQFLDYFYTEEAEDLLCWGIEGESYTVNADGSRSFTETILNNPEGKSPQEAILKYATPSYNFANVMLTEPYAAITAILPEQNAARETWVAAGTGVQLPRLTVAADVQSDYSMIMNDVSTYVQEMYIKFIVGEASLENDWDSYVNSLNGMGLETATQYMTDAYALYQQR